MIYGNFDLRRGDHDGKAVQNKPPRWGGNDDPALTVLNAETTAVFLGSSAALAIPEHVRKLQEDLVALGFSIAGKPDGEFGTRTEWAVREFQIYASMLQIARIREEKKGQLLLDESGVPVRANHTDAYYDSSAAVVAKMGKAPAVTGTTLGPVSYYVDSLESATNASLYAGPISGVVNEGTKVAIEYWLDHDYRCPVIIEAWHNASTGARTHMAQQGCNLWAHDSFISGDPRMFAKDFTNYYSYPPGRLQADYHALGYYQSGTFGGPNTGLKHSWAPEADMSIVNVLGEPYSSENSDSAKISTYRTVRVVAEAECYGRFDVLNAWDNALMSAGPCHWTMGVFGSEYDDGELSGFIAYFKNLNAEDFFKAFGRFGLDTALQWGDKAMYSAGVRTYNSWVKLSTETAFENLPRTKEGAHYLKTWHWHYRFSMAGRTIYEYRKAMWSMAKLRLDNLLKKEVVFKVSDREVASTLGAVFTSEKAVAILLRWHVYRPAHVVSGASRVVPTIQVVVDSTAQLNWALPVEIWGDAHESALTTGIFNVLASLNNTIVSAIEYGTNLPQGAVRTGRNSFVMDGDL